LILKATTLGRCESLVSVSCPKYTDDRTPRMEGNY
jgi:hypothetical protein